MDSGDQQKNLRAEGLYLQLDGAGGGQANVGLQRQLTEWCFNQNLAASINTFDQSFNPCTDF